MSKREAALRHIRYAGYHGDAAALTRLYIENRVSYAAAHEAYREGARMRANGMRCGCRECGEKAGSVKPKGE